MEWQQRKALAARIPAARRASGMSQADLAISTGLSRRQIGNIERGSVPQAATLLRIMDVLGMVERDPAVDADLEALLVIVENLVKRLPREHRAEWAAHMTEDLVARIRDAADLDEAITEEEQAADRAQLLAGGPEVGVDEAAARRDRDDVSGVA